MYSLHIIARYVVPPSQSNGSAEEETPNVPNGSQWTEAIKPLENRTCDFCASKGVRPNELSAICPSVQMSLRKTCIYISALVDVYIPRERRRTHLTHPSSSIQSCPFAGRLVDPSLQLGV